MALEKAGQRLDMMKLLAVEVTQLDQARILRQHGMSLGEDQAVPRGVLRVVEYAHVAHVENRRNVCDGTAAAQVAHLAGGYHIQNVRADPEGHPLELARVEPFDFHVHTSDRFSQVFAVSSR